MSKGDFTSEWKTPSLGKDISRIELGGSNYAARENIFYSGGTLMRGVNKKGKQFWQLDTNLTETINAF